MCTAQGAQIIAVAQQLEIIIFILQVDCATLRINKAANNAV